VKRAAKLASVLNVPGVRSDAHVGYSQKGVGCEVSNLQGIAVLGSHFLDDTADCRAYSLVFIEAEGVFPDHTRHVEECPAGRSQLCLETFAVETGNGTPISGQRTLAQRYRCGQGRAALHQDCAILKPQVRHIIALP
jgi:hypothetical protein